MYMMEFHALWNDGSNACGGWEEVMLLLNVITVSVTMFGADFRLVAVSNPLLTSNQLKLFLLNYLTFKITLSVKNAKFS